MENNTTIYFAGILALQPIDSILKSSSPNSNIVLKSISLKSKLSSSKQLYSKNLILFL